MPRALSDALEQGGGTLGSGWGWALVVTAVALGVGISALRVVPPSERLVVSRLGRAYAAKGPGLVAAIPGVDRAVRVSLRTVCHDLPTVQTVTAEGITVRVRAVVLATVRDPVRFATAIDAPMTATAAIAETALRHHIAQLRLGELVHAWSQPAADLPKAIEADTLQWGVAVTLVQIAHVVLPVSTELLDWAEQLPGTRQAGARGHRRRNGHSPLLP